MVTKFRVKHSELIGVANCCGIAELEGNKQSLNSLYIKRVKF